ncbi:hypothetical protein [Yoonia sediminilitoris]|uniref:Uncharacterized protein n=1 Tax=Yoonia sediminilitoris TaxID=1286148 RepID=A0A2T6KRI3_9RHOB|nr:hypothetical protein [Yoonia sediminilitoris]PUB19171.1 hypothetical protein C8N45_101764 [Yoonia sediminilitoris]RCW99339.1 hypothetical protein DFP92_101764 [Yoonia sediminilitoris]
MSLSAFLYPILVTGAGIMAKTSATEFAKGAGKRAFEALMKRLKDDHGVASVALIDQAAEKEEYAAAIQADLDSPQISKDPEIKILADQLLAAIEAMPKEERQQFALDAEAIRAEGNQVFKDIEGVRAKEIVAGGDQTFEGISTKKD